ncbi:MAG: glycosyltransferase family 2 protein [Methylophilaceae bacterium]
MLQPSQSMLFSVVIPTYNRAGKLLSMIQSVLLQAETHRVEIIVVDDGSTDDTHAQLSSLKSSGNIHYVAHKTNRGVCAARNTGIAQAKGKLLLFLDSDDILLAGALEYIVQHFEQSPDTDVLFGGTVTFDNVAMCRVENSPARLDFEKIMEGRATGDFLAVCRSRVFEKFRFDEALNGFEGITWLQIAQAGYSLVYDEHALRSSEYSSDGLSGYAALTNNPLRFATGYLAQLRALGTDIRETYSNIYDEWVLKSILYHRLAGKDVRGIIQNNPAMHRSTRLYILLVRSLPMMLLCLLFKLKVRIQVQRRRQ